MTTSILGSGDSLSMHVELGKRIGGGAFGAVHRGRFHGTEVAVKLVEGGPAELRSFESEAKMLATLRHPNITLFMGAFLDPRARRWAIVTEFVDRGSLWDVLREPQLDWNFRRQTHVALGIARGLTYLHAHQPPVVHRDVKSPNVLVDDAFRVKLCDVGLARYSTATVMTVGCGTPQWMAPEIANSLPYGPAADVFSFGIVLSEIAARRCPYDDHPHLSGIALAVNIVHNNLRPFLPPDSPFSTLATHCWHPNPRARPSMKSVLASLDTILSDLP